MSEKEAKKTLVAEREEETLAFWRANRIFQKTLETPAGETPKGEFVFYDGPPFATGLPHIGHILASTIKDLIPRYQTMKGNRVARRWGWDCHGLPIETIVEKKLGIKNKQEIEQMGIDVFNTTAKEVVLEYVHEWEKTVDRIGRWVDFEGSYKTMDNSYIESVWWALSELHKKGHLYEGRRVLQYCPRCETPLSKAETAMDNSYKDVTEESVFVEFKVKNPAKHGFRENAYLLAWTTTPWTLPANVALAVNPLMEYVEVAGDVPGNTYVLAKALLEKVFEGKYEVVRTLLGSNLANVEYEPLYELDALKKLGKRSHFVATADFVTAEDGTGIVHTAVMYGEDDYALGLTLDLPQLPLLDAAGHFNQYAPEALVGQYFKKGEKWVKEDLEKRGLLFARKMVSHSYPHCYRCGTALIYNAIPSWFLGVQEAKKKALVSNEKMNWVPEHLQHGRYKHIVENAPDWNISRNRYWASPLPIWKCAECEKIRVVGGLDELKEHSFKSGNSYFVLRHGEAEHMVHGVADSGKDHVKLTQAGREVVVRSAGELKSKGIDFIVASPVLRTKETAQIAAAELGVDPESIIYDERLREIDFGVFDGKPIGEYRSFFTDLKERFTKTPEDGENLTQIKNRVTAALYDLERTYKGKRILIVSHETPLWMLSVGATGGTPDDAVDQHHDENYLNAGLWREIPFVPLPHNNNYELDLHRPYSDHIVLVCECGNEMRRISEVVDCWVESGSMPFASVEYPRKNKEWFTSHFPAQFVAEYIAQTRTWFYYSHILSTMLFDSIPFENIVTTGNILAEDGSKMSKSKGNFPDNQRFFDTYGVDALRFYLMSSPVMRSEDVNFSELGVKEVANKIVSRLTNVLTFFEQNKEGKGTPSPELDAWILSRLGEMVREVTLRLDRYELDLAMRPIADFIEDFSVWYIRRSRKNFSPETTRFVLVTLAKIMAPVTPFVAEQVYQKVKGENGRESVHLESWPNLADSRFEKHLEVEQKMNKTREVVEAALAVRAAAGIKVRQPLAKLTVTPVLADFYPDLVADELNVKEVVSDTSTTVPVLDLTITPELKLEGEYRELVRTVQELRKTRQLLPTDRIVVSLSRDYSAILEKFDAEFRMQVGADRLLVRDGGLDLSVIR